MTKTSVKLPNKMTRNLSFHDLTPLAVKVFLFAVHLRERASRHRDKGPWEVTFPWDSLVQYTSPDVQRAAANHDYRSFYEALDQLLHVKIRYSYKRVGARWPVKEHYNLIGGWEHDAERQQVSITFHERLNRALDLLMQEAADFTLLPLHDVMQLDNLRQIRVLFWAAQVVALKSEERRTIPLEDVRNALGLTDPYYDQWSRVRDVLLKHAKAVGQRTAYAVVPVAVKQGRTVTAVRFDSKRGATI